MNYLVEKNTFTAVLMFMALTRLPSVVLNLIWVKNSTENLAASSLFRRGILCALFLEFLGEPWHQISVDSS